MSLISNFLVPMFPRLTDAIILDLLLCVLIDTLLYMFLGKISCWITISSGALLLTNGFSSIPGKEYLLFTISTVLWLILQDPWASNLCRIKFQRRIILMPVTCELYIVYLSLLYMYIFVFFKSNLQFEQIQT